jgi:hypothetical protein
MKSSKPKDGVDILEFVDQMAAQSWVAAHVLREFPRLACGFIYLDRDTRQVNLLSIPNNSPNPTEFWHAEPAGQIRGEKFIYQRGEVLGFFSSRAPGKPATPEQLNITWNDVCSWVLATDRLGKVTEHGLYYFPGSYTENRVRERMMKAPFRALGNGEVFAEQSIILSGCVQQANRQMMEWLRKHPDDLLRVHPGTFERIMAEIFHDQGYEVEVLGSWNQPDGGIDIIAIKRDTVAGPYRVGIQCKRYVNTRIVRADLVWALEGRLEKFHLHKGVLATTARFEQSVLSSVEDHLWRIELRDFQRLKTDIENWGHFEQGSTGIWLPK